MATINNWNNQVIAANDTFNGGTMNIGNDATDNAINIGTASNTGRIITLGNATGTSGIVLTSASGNIVANTGLTVNSSGIAYNTKQPLFCAYNANQILNVTGDGTTYTIAFDSTTINQGSVYNTGTHLFTAPVTGNYFFIFVTELIGPLTSSHTSSTIVIGSTNAKNQFYRQPYHCGYGTYGAYCVFASTLNNMTAADTANVKVQVTGGTKVVGIQGTLNYSCFMGYLVC
jgi:C1q domain